MTIFPNICFVLIFFLLAAPEDGLGLSPGHTYSATEESGVADDVHHQSSSQPPVMTQAGTPIMADEDKQPLSKRRDARKIKKPQRYLNAVNNKIL